VAFVDEQHVGIHVHLGIDTLEMVGVAPMRRSAESVEQTCRGEDVRTGADRDQPGPRADVFECCGQFGGEIPLVEGRAQLVRRGDDDGVGGGEQLAPMVDRDAEVSVGPHGIAVNCARQDLVQRPILDVEGTPEDARGDPEFEGYDSVKSQYDDAMRTRHGSILSYIGNLATVLDRIRTAEFSL
jgi:hypothetical protein